MTYPPPWRQAPDTAAALELMREHPIAHLFTAHNGLGATVIPFVTDADGGAPTRLRGHINKNNPIAVGLDGAEALVAFSGHSTYVSPYWRVEPTRGGTIDFEEVTVRGTVRVIEGLDVFRAMIDDLSALLEPRYAEVGDYPIWNSSVAPEGYFERLVPQVVQFTIEIDGLEMISKLHQNFPEADRRSIADHLARSGKESARAIAEKIRASL